MLHPVARRRYHHDADAGVSQILLELDPLVGGHHHIKRFAGRGAQQLSASHATPAFRMHGGNYMITQVSGQLTRQRLV